MTSFARYTARVLAVLIGLTAFVGLWVTGPHLWAIINLDTPMDLTRMALSGALIYAGFMARSEVPVHLILVVVGSAYLLIALVSLVNPTVGGLLPSGQVGQGIAIQFLVGALTLAVGIAPSRGRSGRPSVTHGS